uniref:Uncharacterized protein n=1 Tax=Platysiphonia delicata TaxID=2006979 RepID=A0A1Z1M0X3_9FLOR|nr:hypothetical protein [Platysiphonia delicata]ARW59540.1 hypothetical protein [Platysiphonia delicata]
MCIYIDEVYNSQTLTFSFDKVKIVNKERKKALGQSFLIY